MSNTPSQKLKLLALYDIFKKETDEDHVLSVSELIALLEKAGAKAERRSIYSDIHALQEYGVDLLYSRGAGKNGYFLASREFELPEVRLLIDAVQSASFITPNKTKELVGKLEGLCSRHLAKQIGDQVYFSSTLKQHVNETIYYGIDLIGSAIREVAKVKLLYSRRRLTAQISSKMMSRDFTVSPYAMGWWNGFYYLICNNEKYDNLMHLRLDRITNVEVLHNNSARPFSEVSEYTYKFDTGDYLSKVFSMFGGADIQTIELRCDLSLLDSVYDRFGPEVPLRVSGDSHFVARVEVAVSEGLLSWILQFGAKVEVLSTPELRQEIRAKARELRHLYKV